MNWVQNNWKFLTATSVGAIALILSMKSCSDTSDLESEQGNLKAAIEDVRGTSNKNDSILTASMTELVNKINNLGGRVSGVESRMGNLEDRMDAVEEIVDSVKARVDSVVAVQKNCECTNPQKKKPVTKPAKKYNKPAVVSRPDTVVAVVAKPVVTRDTVRVQNAQGCGNNQNASVNIGNNSNNNTVVITNGNAMPETEVTVSRRTCVVVNTYGYSRCR